MKLEFHYLSRPDKIIPAFHEKYICLFRDYKRLALENQSLHAKLHEQVLKKEETRLKIEKYQFVFKYNNSS